MTRLAFTTVLGLMLPPLHADPLGAAWKSDVFPIVERYCYDCHGEGIHKGDLDLEDFPDIASMQADREQWKRIRSHLDQQLMPPPDEDQPSAEQRRKLVEWIDAAVFPVDPEHPDPGRVTLRRLNRTEYENTLRDLLGVNVGVRDLLPPDDSGHGFDNIGDVLTLSPAHLERFLEAARVALDAAVHPDPMPPPVIALPGRKLEGPGHRTEQGHFLYIAGEAAAEVRIPASGRYRISVTAAGTLGGDIPPQMQLKLDEKVIDEWTVDAAMDHAGNYSVETRFDRPAKHRIAASFTNDFWDEKIADPARRDRNLMVHAIRIQGPLDAPPPEKPRSHRQIYGKRPDGASDEEWATEVLRRFARRAFRRPPHEAEAERYLHFVRLARDQGQDVEHGIRLALEAMLVSPAFLFREEPQPEPDNAKRIHLIDEHALASRLSYFLWSSMPDERLMKLADQGRLRENLDAEIDRMLDAPRLREFVSNFTGQWLQLRDLPGSRPSRRVFRRFDPGLVGDMRRETEMFFEHLVRENRPITELLDADYSFLNDRLARHYGVPNVAGRDFRRVSLEGSPRRGLLTQGSFLLLTSHPLRTSPVLRGKYVLENLLDTAPPPPPPNVAQLDPPKHGGGALSLRQRMERHRADPGCAACHALMDPIGFGLENYDADASYRTTVDNQPIDVSGQLVSGRRFAGADELREILLSDHRREFLRAIASKLLTYGLGRGTDWYDRPALDTIIRETEAAEGRSHALIRSVIHSVPFQYRRGEG